MDNGRVTITISADIERFKAWFDYNFQSLFDCYSVASEENEIYYGLDFDRSEVDYKVSLHFFEYVYNFDLLGKYPFPSTYHVIREKLFITDKGLVEVNFDIRLSPDGLHSKYVELFRSFVQDIRLNWKVHQIKSTLHWIDNEEPILLGGEDMEIEISKMAKKYRVQQATITRWKGIIVYLEAGLTIKQIAEREQVSEETIKSDKKKMRDTGFYSG